MIVTIRQKKQLCFHCPEAAMHNVCVFLLFLILSTEKQQYAIFLSINREDIYKHKHIGRSPILFDISLTNKSQTDSNI